MAPSTRLQPGADKTPAPAKVLRAIQHVRGVSHSTAGQEATAIYERLHGKRPRGKDRRLTFQWHATTANMGPQWVQPYAQWIGMPETIWQDLCTAHRTGIMPDETWAELAAWFGAAERRMLWDVVKGPLPQGERIGEHRTRLPLATFVERIEAQWEAEAAVAGGGTVDLAGLGLTPEAEAAIERIMANQRQLEAEVEALRGRLDHFEQAEAGGDGEDCGDARPAATAHSN